MIFRMETGLLEQTVFGGTETGGNLDDYRCRANWISSASARYFHKYADMEETGRIENTMIPLLRLGEMYLIAAESQSDNLAAGVSYVNTLRRNRGVGEPLKPHPRAASIRIHPRTVRRRTTVLPIQTHEHAHPAVSHGIQQSGTVECHIRRAPCPTRKRKNR